MEERQPLDRAEVEPLLVEVLKGNPQKVVGWMRDEPGCWGFLAGQAVTGCKNHSGRSLTDGERRYVWHRLWQMLEQVKAEVMG